MIDWLDAASQLVTVLGFVGVLFSLAVIKPINGTIMETRDDVREIKDGLKRYDERLRDLEVKIVEVEQRAKSAHHRIDGLQNCTQYGIPVSEERDMI